MLLCWVGAELREEGPRTSPAQLSCGLSDQPNARATHWSPAHSRGQSPHSFLPGDGGGARPPAFRVRSESHGQPENHQLASLLGGCRAGSLGSPGLSSAGFTDGPQDCQVVSGSSATGSSGPSCRSQLRAAAVLSCATDHALPHSGIHPSVGPSRPVEVGGAGGAGS